MLSTNEASLKLALVPLPTGDCVLTPSYVAAGILNAKARFDKFAARHHISF
jgi:hypothetical protein